MKLQDKLININNQQYMTNGLNVFSLISAVLLWAHLVGELTWWAFPVTVITTMIAFGCEIAPRPKGAKF